MDRTGGKLDEAVLAHRADPTEANRQAVLAQMRDHSDSFYREQAAAFQGRTRQK